MGDAAMLSLIASAATFGHGHFEVVKGGRLWSILFVAPLIIEHCQYSLAVCGRPVSSGFVEDVEVHSF
jgi:hypothetical protein